MRVFVTRLIAFLLDQVVVALLFVAPQGIIALVSGSWFLDADSSNVLTWAWVGISVTLPSLAYFVVCDYWWSGKTIGKRVLGVRAYSRDGSSLSFAQALGRNVVKLIPWEATHIMIYFPEPFSDADPSLGKMALMMLSTFLLTLWFLVPLVDRSGHNAIHDRVAGTKVVQDSSRLEPTAA